MQPLPDNAYARVIIMPFTDNDDDPEALKQPVSTSFQRVRLITPELILTKIANIGQSKRSFLVGNKMRIHVVHTIPNQGNGRKTDCIQIRNKRSIFSVCGYTNHCLAECIVYGKELHENSEWISKSHFKWTWHNIKYFQI